jgi:hypothetical protein
MYDMSYADKPDMTGLVIEGKTIRIPRPIIKVTEEITTRACRSNSRHCVIVEAIREAVPTAVLITVDLQTIRWSDKGLGLRYIFLTPLPAQKALVRFDAGEPISPFSFQLRGGRAVSMYKGGSLTKTGDPQRQRHNLGKARVLTAAEYRRNSGIGEPVEVVGGKAPPRLNPAHASNQAARIFGLRAFTEEWKLKEEPPRAS